MPAPLGGSRPWFRCPGYGGRKAILYLRGGRFRCRACHDLAHGSTREAPWERARRRADGLRERLGGEVGGFLPPFPDKPRNMRWRTYDRLAGELQASETAARAGLDARGDALIARLERKYGKGR